MEIICDLILEPQHKQTSVSQKLTLYEYETRIFELPINRGT